MATIAPIIHVYDVDATVAYYRDVLGFEVDWVIGHDGSGRNTFASVNWFGATLKFVDPGEPVSDVARSLLGAGMAFSFEDSLIDIDRYYGELKARGVDIILEIADQPSGHRSFHIRDLNGYHLAFSLERAAPVSADGPWAVVSGRAGGG
ncbi:MAG TPA: VOC family protein [Thermomicrobiaceae bacterium]|nr:VOC family protein [Thermomicrobiaceae bacterium]